ncbi:DUF2007 domain-containing protein [Myxococcota bacterium]|nr:DUF2007 domain-containing protein [Myxococcota bacterium]
MKKIYVARDPAEANIVRGMLASHGLDVEIRGEALWTARGLLPLTTDTAPTLWVRDDDAERALALIEAVGAAPAGGDAGPWRCAKCGEEVEPELGECWSCGTARPGE